MVEMMGKAGLGLMVWLAWTGCDMPMGPVQPAPRDAKPPKVAPQPARPAVVTDVPPREETFQVPRAFDDPLYQALYEREAEVHRALFVQPRMGTYLRLVRDDGFGIWAFLRAAGETTVEFMIDETIMSLPRNRLSMETQAVLYTNVFAVKQARERVERAMKAGLLYEPTLPLSPLTTHAAEEARLMVADLGEARMGPGRSYQGRPSTSLYRGRQVTALAREGLWILIADPEQPGEPLGWVPRFSTMSARPSDINAVYEDVSLLMREGLVLRIDPVLHNVWLDGNLWVATPSAAIEGIGRVMSEYIRQKVGGSAVRVEFFEGLSNQHLASYGAATGLRRVR